MVGNIHQVHIDTNKQINIIEDFVNQIQTNMIYDSQVEQCEYMIILNIFLRFQQGQQICKQFFFSNFQYTEVIYVNYNQLYIMYKQNRQKKPGIRLKQLEIFKQRTNLFTEDDCYQFGQKLLKFNGSSQNLHSQQNRSRSRKKIFGDKEKSLNTSRVAATKLIDNIQKASQSIQNKNKIDKLELDLKNLQCQLNNKDIKINEIEQKLIDVQIFHQEQVKLKNRELDILREKLKQISQDLKNKNLEITTLKLQLQNNKRCNTILSQNELLSFRSNLKQPEKVFSDISDSKIQQNINFLKKQKPNKHPTIITTTEIQSFQNNFFNKQIRLSPLNSNLLSSFDNSNMLFDKSLNFKGLNQSSLFDNVPPFTNRQSSNQHIPQFLLKNDTKDQQPSEYLSPLDFNIDKKLNFDKKSSNQSEQNDKEFNFANLRNIQEYYY